MLPLLLFIATIDQKISRDGSNSERNGRGKLVG